MKKYSWIVVLLLALSLGFLGCPDKEPPDEGGWEHNLAGKTLDLVDNFQYGKGYQGVGSWPELFDGSKITTGDVYSLKITFTASRDLTDLLYVGLVDPSADAGYWKTLSWPGDPDKPAQVGEGNIKKDEVISAEIEFTAIASSTGTDAAKNTLVFMTDSTDGTPGTANSGTLGTITLTFSEFIFAKEGSGEDVPEPPPPPPPPPPDAERVDLGDFTWVNNDTQKGWRSNGTDSTETDLQINELVTAKYLVLELSAPPAGGFQIVWQGTGDWGWNSNSILTDSGEAIPDKGTSIEGNTLKIELSLALVKYEQFQGSTQAKILLAYYSPDIDGLGIEEAYLLYE
jgi:hypothetical protein